MKIFSRTLLMVLLLVTGITLFAKSGKATVQIRTQIYCDHCLNCESCGPTIQQAVYAVEGVHKVKVQPEKNMIVVTYNPEKANLLSIKLSIANAGYDADEIRASQGGLSRLDGCCKK